ncbi:unnamed protein product [Clonostachys rhizophaga]|uniref:Uncharacterized protein n=1 Tax=Clonostachys rhizophaga TaxID=160324 RepID=A0A9N9V7X3_9HYPO|nr:unnamed protein product [Clonostachys rhizophaga]
MINFNLSATFNVVRILFKPSICLPHHTVSNFNDLPIPLDKALQREGRAATDIRAVVLDKDDCFAYPDQNEVYPDYKDKFEALQNAYPGRRLLIVSNTAGAQSWDPKLKLAVEVEKNTGVSVLSHSVKKPGCGREIMEYFKQHPETGVTHPSQIAVVGDRLTTDMMLANMMGGWGFWIRDGVIPLKKKSFVSIFVLLIHIQIAVSNAKQFSRIERPLSAFLMARGVVAMDPRSPFEEHFTVLRCLTPTATTGDMGGKTWNKAEELIFWRTIIPQSPQAANMSDRLKSWNQCAAIMQEMMGRPKRRIYTKTMLYEHYYQNIKTRRHSPQARPFVREHMQELEKNLQARDEVLGPSTPERNPRPESRQQDKAMASTDEVASHDCTPDNTDKTTSSSSGGCSPFEALLIATNLDHGRAISADSSYADCSLSSISVISASEVRDF